MKLTASSRKWLAVQEGEIESAIRTGQELRLLVAQRLRDIHARFFAADAPERGALGGWESYCEQRWGFSRSRGYQLLDLALVSTMVDSPDLTERQARELVGLDPLEAKEAYQAAGGPDATADQVAAEVERLAQDPRRGESRPDPAARVRRAAAKLVPLLRHVDLPGDGEAAELLLDAGTRLALGEPSAHDLQLAELARAAPAA